MPGDAREGGGKRPSRARRSAPVDVEKLKRAVMDLEEVNRQIRESQIELILNLAIAAEYKDPDTGNHILRISDYSAELGKAVGLRSDELEILRYASPMHDIGKIGIPDRILQKPGKLDPDEWEMMKQHTVIGWRMFHNSSSPLLKAVADIAISHHERFDGTGYPHGTKGERIPLYGRVIAIVDIFDALVSRRCYKTEWTVDDAFRHIQELSGTHLDPGLVSAFLRSKKKVLEVYQANKAIQQFIDGFNETELRLE